MCGVRWRSEEKAEHPAVYRPGLLHTIFLENKGKNADNIGE